MSLLIFNKVYRQEKALIDDIAKKLRKSIVFNTETVTQGEKYHLDNELIIEFDVSKHDIKIYNGNNFAEFNCTFDQYNEMQQKRFGWFSALLNIARERKRKTECLADRKEQLLSAKDSLALAKEKQQEEYNKKILQIQNMRNMVK